MKLSSQIKNLSLKYFARYQKRKTFKELFVEHQGKVSIKWEIYLNEYERLLSPLKEKPTSVLEIGVLNGGSLEIMGKYLPKANLILGCDINTDCRKLSFSDETIKVIIGDVLQDSIYSAITELSHQFDIIIDDGSHRSGDVIRTFAKYFPLLSENGAYIVEDIHASYWSDYNGGLFDPLSSISFIKKLIDVTQFQSWGTDLSIENFMADFNDFFSIPIDWDFLRTIHSIEIINSMCVIKKAHKESNELGNLLFAGQEESVMSVTTNQLINEPLQPVSQINNILSSNNLKEFSTNHVTAISRELKN